jgi:hypothetical protein
MLLVLFNVAPKGATYNDGSVRTFPAENRTKKQKQSKNKNLP